MACHVQAYLHMYDVTRGLRKNGSFLLNTIWEGEEPAKNLPNRVKKYFAKNNISVYYINATQIAQKSVWATVPILSFSLHSSVSQALSL